MWQYKSGTIWLSKFWMIFIDLSQFNVYIICNISIADLKKIRNKYQYTHVY